VVTGLTVVHGRTAAVREVSLTLSRGRVTALMGRNGSGKSSLLWALQGSGSRRSGAVAVDGIEPADPALLRPADRRSVVGLLPQQAADLLYLETVDEECAAGGADTRAILDSLAPGIPGDQHPRDLSEGQRLSLALALVLATRPPVVLLDEPTRGLDYRAKHVLAAALRRLVAEGRTVVVSTHDVEFTALVADDVVVLAEGQVVSSGPVRRVVAESPAFAPQVTKVLGPPWLRVDEVLGALVL
jgi:energy-coupling factor transport system ATP-binding protein